MSAHFTHTLFSLAAYYHDLSPFIVRFTDTFGIRWYGLSYVLGFMLGYLTLRWLARRGLAPFPAERVGDVLMWLVACVLVGGRLAYCLIYDRALLFHFSSSFPFWGFFQIHKGGMASHGGIVGAIIAALRISRGFRDERTGQIVGTCHPMQLLDSMALATPLGLMLGRLANFINGELLGKVIAPPGTPGGGPWWTVQFPQELLAVRLGSGPQPPHAPPLSQEQLQQLHSLAIAQLPPGTLERLGPERAVDAFELGVMRLVENAAHLKPQLTPFLSARFPSQLVQAFGEGPFLLAGLWLIAARPRKIGIIGAWFMLLYGVQRIVTEIWRLPDAQFGNEGRPLGLSRGQWLSAAMVAIGIGAILWAIRRRGPKVGGWLRRGSVSAG